MTKEEAINILEKTKKWEFVPDSILDEALDMAIKALERSTGHWINYNTPCFSECSECSHPFDWADNCMEDWQYCPNCGAKMESEVKA